MRSSLTNVLIGFIIGALFVSVFTGRKAELPKGQVIAPLSVQSEDEFFIGDLETTDIPQRRGGYVYKSNQYQELYDKTWTEGGYPRQSCWGCRFATDVIHKVGGPPAPLARSYSRRLPLSATVASPLPPPPARSRT